MKAKYRYEKHFQRDLIRLFERERWRPFETRGKGLPDLFVTCPIRGAFWAELKRCRKQSRLTPEQRTVIRELRDNGETVYVWYPDMWREIHAIVAGCDPQDKIETIKPLLMKGVQTMPTPDELKALREEVAALREENDRLKNNEVTDEERKMARELAESIEREFASNGYKAKAS